MIIHFFTVEYEILQLSTNGHSFFHSEIRNFTVVYKRSFIFSQQKNLFFFKFVCFLSLLTAYLVTKLQLQNEYSQLIVSETNRWLVCLIFYYQPNSLQPLQTVYLTKFSNLPKLITYLHLYKTRITLPRNIDPFPTPPQKIMLPTLIGTHFFTAIFPAINHCLG